MTDDLHFGHFGIYLNDLLLKIIFWIFRPRMIFYSFRGRVAETMNIGKADFAATAPTPAISVPL
jgi:hypothetical protein